MNNQRIYLALAEATVLTPNIDERNLVKLQKLFESFITRKIDVQYLFRQYMAIVGPNGNFPLILNVLSENQESCKPIYHSPYIHNQFQPFPMAMYHNHYQPIQAQCLPAHQHAQPLGASELRPKFNRSTKQRAWTPQEDNFIKQAVIEGQPWQKVEEAFGGTRSKSQVSQRWNRTLDPAISNDFWTEKEEERLLELVNKHGPNSWKKISRIMQNRSDVQCRFHYKQIIAKRVRAVPICFNNDNIIKKHSSDGAIPTKLILPSIYEIMPQGANEYQFISE